AVQTVHSVAVQRASPTVPADCRQRPRPCRRTRRLLASSAVASRAEQSQQGRDCVNRGRAESPVRLIARGGAALMRAGTLVAVVLTSGLVAAAPPQQRWHD